MDHTEPMDALKADRHYAEKVRFENAVREAKAKLGNSQCNVKEQPYYGGECAATPAEPTTIRELRQRINELEQRQRDTSHKLTFCRELLSVLQG